MDLAFVEVADVLWKHTHLLGRIPVDRYRDLASRIKPLIANSVLKVESSMEILEPAIDNASKLGITVYDSLYVTLALAKNGKLVSFDESLMDALRGRGSNIVVSP